MGLYALNRVVARAPGRVNLIGEHTDYNDGLALPFAIEKGVTVTRDETGGDSIEAIARDLGERDELPVEHPDRATRRRAFVRAPGERDELPVEHAQRATGWRAFFRGTVAELQAAGHELRPCRLTIEGDLPRGAGLSSSAALTAALCLALTDDPGDRVELAKLCSRVENDWVGAETGLLDQLAALCSQEGHALRIDFRTLGIDPVPLDLGDWQLVTVDSEAPHDHAAGGYNERRAECRAAAETLGIDSLRDAEGPGELPAPLDRRVRHVLTENRRVDAMVAALAARDMREVGRLLDASHASLRDDYEASVPAVETTVDRLKEAGAAGARMVGGGFGGAVLALFGPGAVPPADALAVAPGPAARRL